MDNHAGRGRGFLDFRDQPNAVRRWRHHRTQKIARWFYLPGLFLEFVLRPNRLRGRQLTTFGFDNFVQYSLQR